MSLFDPETGKLTDPEALRSIQLQARGRTLPKVVINDDDTKSVQVLDDQTGRQQAIQTYHGSGRVDAIVTPETVSTAGTTQEM